MQIYKQVMNQTKSLPYPSSILGSSPVLFPSVCVALSVRLKNRHRCRLQLLVSICQTDSKRAEKVDPPTPQAKMLADCQHMVFARGNHLHRQATTKMLANLQHRGQELLDHHPVDFTVDGNRGKYTASVCQDIIAAGTARDLCRPLSLEIGLRDTTG